MALLKSCLAVLLGVALSAGAASADPAKTPRQKKAARATPTPSPAPTAEASASAETPPAETTPPAGGGAPCTAPEYRQFDFWLGEWNVLGPDGKTAGENRVVSILNGCVLQEHWAGVKGTHGTSFNLYDSGTRHWHQTWVDDAGGLLLLDGELRDGRMILLGRRPSEKQKGVTITHRIAWTPIAHDRVRQYWEASANEGRSWQVVFDGTYVRKK